MRRFLPIAALSLIAAAPPPPKYSTPTGVVTESKADEWQAIPADDLMVIDLKDGQRVVVQLAPLFAPVHVANIRAKLREVGGHGLIRTVRGIGYAIKS